MNRIVRKYHGHLSGVYSMALHPTLDLLMTGGRDSSCRVWDMRTKEQVMILTGHTETVGSVIAQSAEPQVITGSFDKSVRCWDLAKGQVLSVLTQHHKSVRGLVAHPTEYTFASASADNIKVWQLPTTRFIRNIPNNDGGILNSLALNSENVLAAAGDNGKLHLYDWHSGHCFQTIESPPQPGSLQAENGIKHCTYDVTGSRLITAEVDKSIKIYRPNENATEQTHPIINWVQPKRGDYGR